MTSRPQQWPDAARAHALSRRKLAKVFAGAMIAGTLPLAKTEPTSAQEDIITLAGAASELTAAPGAASARGAAAEAVAAQGAARADAAAALAEARSGEGAIAMGAAAASAAEPDQGALARGAMASTSASNQTDGFAASDRGGGGKAPAYSFARRGGGGRGGGRRVRGVGGAGGRRRQRHRVDRLPATGTSGVRHAPPAAILGLASAAAALGALLLRQSSDSEQGSEARR